MSFDGFTTFALFGLLILLVLFSGYLFCKYRQILLMIALLQANMKVAEALPNVVNSFNDDCESLRREINLELVQGNGVYAQVLREKLLLCESEILSKTVGIFTTVLPKPQILTNLISDEIFVKLSDIGTTNFLVILALMLVVGLCIYSVHFLVLKIKCNKLKLKTIYCLVFRSSIDFCVIDIVTVNAYYSSLAVFAEDGNVSNISLGGKFFPKLFFSWTGFKIEDRDSGKIHYLKTSYKLSLCDARRLARILKQDFSCNLAMRSGKLLLSVEVQHTHDKGPETCI